MNKITNPPIAKEPAGFAGLFSFQALVLVLLTLGVALVGWFYFRDYERDYRTEVDRQLLAIADMKVNDIDHWRQERLGDAMSIYRNPAFSNLARRFLADPSDMSTRLELLSWLSNLQNYYKYERIYLLDPAGNERISVPFAFPAAVSPLLRAELPATLERGQIQFWGFHHDFPNTPPHLGILIPILDEQDDDLALGLLVMRINPNNSLFPAIQLWPLPSQSGEALLIRREGDEVVFLSNRRFAQDGAPNLRFPLSRADLICVQAVLDRRGIIEGVDYLDQPAIAAAQSVPGTDWLLLAKINRDEVYSALQTRLWPALIAVSALFLLAGLGLGRIWRNQQATRIQERLEAAHALIESEARTRAILNASSDVIFLVDLDGRLLTANQAFANLIQNDPEAFIGNSVFDFTPPEMVETRRERLRTIAQNGQPLRFQDDIQDRVIIESLYPIFGAEGQVAGVAIYGLNLTEQFQMAQALRKSEALLREMAANFPHSYISIIEKDLTVGFTSGQEFKRLNLNPDDFVGQSIEQVFGEHAALIKEHYLRTFQGEETEFEQFINGQYQLYRTAPLYDPEGEIHQILAVVENISERKQAEESLFRYYERMQSLTNILQFDAQDEQGLLDYALEEAVRMTGSQVGFIDLYDEEKQEFVMKSWSRQVMAECALTDTQTSYQLEKAGLWAEAVRQRRPVMLNDYQADHPGKQGYPPGHVDLTNYISAPVFEGEQIKAVIGVANKDGDYDQTDMLQLELLMDAVWKGVQKRRATVELRQARDDWERTFNTIPDLIALIDVNHRFMRVNQAMAEQLGLSPDEMVGKTCYEIVHCAEHPPTACPLSKMLTSGVQEQTEMDEQNLGGRFNITTTPLYNEEGELVGCVHVARDISAARQAEEKLRNSEERLRLALKATNDVVWDWNIIQDRQRWNEAGAQVFGWTEIVEHPQSADWWVERVHPDDRQRVHDSFFAAVHDPASAFWRDEYRFRKADGCYAQVLDRGYVLRNAQGEALRMIGAMLDITERKQAEEEIRNALADNQTLLRELYHRTKNNMYVISSMLAYQGAILPDERLQNVFQDIEDRIRAMALVHEMLYQSQSLSHINFSAYLREMVGYLQVSYHADSQKIAIDLELAPVELLLDYAVPCGLVVNELVANAIKHAFPAERGGQISIRLARISKNELQLEIQDDGVGFPPGLDPMVTNTMGLQIVRRTVEHQLGGKLNFRSEDGVHCRFSFRDIENHEPVG